MNKDIRDLRFRQKSTGDILRLEPHIMLNFCSPKLDSIYLPMEEVELLEAEEKLPSVSESLRAMLGQDIQNIHICFAPIPKTPKTKPKLLGRTAKDE